MRTSMAETSLSTYRSFSTSDLQAKEKDVMAEFAAYPRLTITREKLAERLGWKESAVCGRANSLVAKGALEEIDGGRTASGRSAKLLRVPVAGQQELFSTTATGAPGLRNPLRACTPSPIQSRDSASDRA